MPMPIALLNLGGGAKKEDEVDKSNWTTLRKNVLWCKECGEDATSHMTEDTSAGNIVCTNCGLVLSENIIDYRSEWRTFANDDQEHDDPNRVGDGVNHLLHGSQLETSIGASVGGKAARHLNSAQSRVTDSKVNKALMSVYKEIQAHCDTLNTGKAAADMAKHIYKLVDDGKFLKGKAQPAIISACILIACRQAKADRTFREVYRVTRVSKKDIGRVFKAVESFLTQQKALNQDSVSGVRDYEATASTSAPELCGRFCSGLTLYPQHLVSQLAMEFATKALQVKCLAGRSPLSIAAACIYMTAHLTGQPRSHKDVARVAGVSDGTIKTVYKLIYQSKGDIIDPYGPAFSRIVEFNERQAKEAAKVAAAAAAAAGPTGAKPSTAKGSARSKTAATKSSATPPAVPNAINLSMENLPTS